MNQQDADYATTANVLMIAELLNDSPFLIEDRESKSHFPATALANWLASRGVLVPSALTDGQLADIWWEGNDGRDFTMPGGMREAMERIAKGEPVPQP